METVGIREQKYVKWLEEVRKDSKMWNQVFEEDSAKNLSWYIKWNLTVEKVSITEKLIKDKN